VRACMHACTRTRAYVCLAILQTLQSQNFINISSHLCKTILTHLGNVSLVIIRTRTLNNMH